MAESRREGLKQTLLLGFVALTTLLVPVIWIDNLSDNNTGFVRGTPIPALATPAPTQIFTAVPTLAPTVTPEPTLPPGQPTPTEDHGEG